MPELLKKTKPGKNVPHTEVTSLTYRPDGDRVLVTTDQSLIFDFDAFEGEIVGALRLVHLGVILIRVSRYVDTDQSVALYSRV